MLGDPLSLLLKVHMWQRCVEKKEVISLQLLRIGRAMVSKVCRSIYAWQRRLGRLKIFLMRFKIFCVL